MSFLVKFLKIFIVIAVIAVCASGTANTSSGVSQFILSREAKMRVADSENAFISLPKTIKMYIKVLNGEDKDDVKSTSNQQRLTEDVINIRGDFTVKNNLSNSIKLKRIYFEELNIGVDLYEFTIESGEEKKVSINGTFSYNGKDNINGGTKSQSAKAVLFFEWDGGKSDIYKDVAIYIESVKDKREEVKEEVKKENISQEENKGENTEQGEDTGKDADNMEEDAGENIGAGKDPAENGTNQSFYKEV
ncbi:MAG: hypothetical protein GX094_04075 [Clostridiales bacterium]|jgi:hypothetical protein|nr:hypothetical protein [Clostridiales bacterium]